MEKRKKVRHKKYDEIMIRVISLVLQYTLIDREKDPEMSMVSYCLLLSGEAISTKKYKAVKGTDLQDVIQAIVDRGTDLLTLLKADVL